MLIKKLKISFVSLLAVSLLVIFWSNTYGQALLKYVSLVADKGLYKIEERVNKQPEKIIAAVIPFQVEQPTREINVFFPGRIFSYMMISLKNDAKNPENIVKDQMPNVILTKSEDNAPKKEETPAEEAVVAPPGGEPVVAIYNTHTGETYGLSDGTDRLTGKRGAVVKVAQKIEETLEKKYHISVVRSDTIHDASYNSSYIESEKTVLGLIKKYPHLKILLDIHRDAGRPRQDCFIDIKGKKVARVMIVVGSDARMPFPHWQENLALARKLNDKMNAMYPGLSIGIAVKEGRYNQQYHPGAILVEIGSVKNYTVEALNAGEMVADALAAVLK